MPTIEYMECDPIDEDGNVITVGEQRNTILGDNEKAQSTNMWIGIGIALGVVLLIIVVFLAKYAKSMLETIKTGTGTRTVSSAALRSRT